jgi:hypothetical protein
MRLLPALALSASLALGACQNPDGTTDWGSTAALGIGAAAVAGLVAVAANNNNDRHYRQPPRYYRGAPRYAYRDSGYYRRW